MSIRDHLIRRLHVLTEKLEKSRAEQGTSENWALQMQLGFIAKERGDLDTAAMRYRRVLAAVPPYTETHPWPEAHWHLAQIMMAKKQPEAALLLMEELLAINPNIPEGFGQLGHLLYLLNRREEAVAAYERAFALSTNSSPMAAQSLAYAYLDIRDWKRASHYLDIAVQLNPDNVELKGNCAFLALRMGDYDKGWPQLAELLSEIEAPTNPQGNQHLRQRLGIERLWRGTDLAGKHLLIWCEHSLDDYLMLARYVPRIHQQFGECRITLLAPEALCRLFNASSMGEVIDIHACQNGPNFDYDAHCSMMSLPHIFHSAGHREIPSDVPYLAIPSYAAAQWQEKLSGLKGLKVGFVLAAAPKNARDDPRNLPLTDFSPLFEVPGVTFIGLQKGALAVQITDFGVPVLDFMTDCQDTLDAGALIQCLDLVISADTSVAHLAGALAKPVWLLNFFEGEWRWGINREDSEWYPTMRIFNQGSPDSWIGVVEQLTKTLRFHSLGGGE